MPHKSAAEEYNVSKPVGRDETDLGERKSSREIFDQKSVTSLNDIPVVTHKAFITAGSQTIDDKDLPIPLDTLVEAVIVDGTVVIRQIPDAEEGDPKAVILTGIIPPTTNKEVIQDTGLMVPVTKEPITRVWTKDLKAWQWKDYVKWITGKPEEIAKSTTGIPEGLFHVYLNGPGLFWKPQFTYGRLEEIERNTKAITDKTKLAIISGYTGALNQTRESFNDPDNQYVGVPNAVSVDFPANTSAVDQLNTDFERLLKLFLKDVRTVEIDDTSQSSGVARRLALLPELSYTMEVRHDVKEIYALLGVSKFEFDTILTSTIQERQAEYELLKELRRDGVIDEDKFKKRSGNLV